MGISQLSRMSSTRDLRQMTTNTWQAIPLSRQVTEADNVFLTMDISDEEIYELVKQFHPLKAPGSDDMQVVLFQKSWIVIGKSVCHIVKSLFNSGHMFKEINRTHITLILKIVKSDSVNH